MAVTDLKYLSREDDNEGDRSEPCDAVTYDNVEVTVVEDSAAKPDPIKVDAVEGDPLREVCVALSAVGFLGLGSHCLG